MFDWQELIRVQANKMVADERRRMAEVAALLRETEEERDAVRGAMKVVEGENGRLRELSAGQVSVDATKSEATKPVEPEKPGRVSEDSAGAGQAAEDDTGPGRVSEDSTRPESTADSESTGPEWVMTPDSNKNVPLPSLPASSQDLWNSQDRETTPPKTPPRVHALPVETSPWAEGRA
jgi:hypothetical protein